MRKKEAALLVPLLLLLMMTAPLLSGGTAPAETAEGDLAIAAQFQTESGDAFRGGAARFSAGTAEACCQVGRDGTASVSGLPRSGELRLILFDQQKEVRGSMTLSLGRGAVTDAMTGEDGVGHITVREDAREVALRFILQEDGGMRCALYLASSGGDLTRKGV